MKYSHPLRLLVESCKVHERQWYNKKLELLFCKNITNIIYSSGTVAD